MYSTIELILFGFPQGKTVCKLTQITQFEKELNQFYTASKRVNLIQFAIYVVKQNFAPVCNRALQKLKFCKRVF